MFDTIKKLFKSPFMSVEIEETKSGHKCRLSASGFLDASDWFSYRKKSPSMALYEFWDDMGLNDDQLFEALPVEFEDFLEGYFQAMGFTASDENGEPLFKCQGEWSNTYSTADVVEVIDETNLKKLVMDCADFFLQSYNMLERWNEEQDDEAFESAGRDFHFTRNSHGGGFWDGDWDNDNLEYGDALTLLCRKYKPAELTSYTGYSIG